MDGLKRITIEVDGSFVYVVIKVGRYSPVEYIFDDFDEAIEALPNLDEVKDN